MQTQEKRIVMPHAGNPECCGEVVRPSYEQDAARLKARIALLEATPKSPARDTLIAHFNRLLAGVAR